MEVRQAAPQARSLSHVWICSFTLAVIATLTLYGRSPVLAVAGSLVCAIVVRTSLSPLARSYIVYVLLCLVIAPRFGINAATGVETAEMLAPLWIVAASFGGVLASLRKQSSQSLRSGPFLEPVTPAVIVSLASLVAVYFLQSRDSFGLAGQLATGVSGGGYLGVLAQAGPPSAAGALLSILGRPKAARSALALSAGLVVLQAGALAYSGFRGAAPFYIIAVAICAIGVRGPLMDRPFGKQAFGGVLVASLMIGLFALGVSVREDAALAAGTGQGSMSRTNFLPTIIQRFDESRALGKAWEYRNDAAARSAVSLGDQVTAIIPRVLYPAKGTVDYGHGVSIAVYGSPTTTRNSNTVTLLGDALINLGLAGGLVLIGAYIFLFDTAFRRLRSAATVTSLSIRVAVLVAALDLESPAVLNIVGTIRISLAVLALQWVVKKIIPSRAPATREVETRANLPHDGALGTRPSG